MRILVVGSGGMLGQDLVPALTKGGHAVTPAARRDLDVTDPDACRSQVGGHDVVVNAAAWTAVDLAEEREADAFAVNAVGAAHLARACSEHGVALLHVSTDYVFDGRATTPYAEDALLAPRSAYGRTKAAGEWAVLSTCRRSWIARTAWLYGAGGRNFVSTMVRLAGERETLDVVDDQVGQPTWTVDVAAAVGRILEAWAPFGTYHLTSTGEATWYQLARQLFTELGLDPERVRPTTSARFPRPAERPAFSVLGHEAWDRAGVEPIRHWRAALAESSGLFMSED